MTPPDPDHALVPAPAPERSKIQKAVQRGLNRWERQKQAQQETSLELQSSDDALAALDALMSSPLGRAWIDSDGESSKHRPNFAPLTREQVLAPLPRRKMLATSGLNTPSMASDVVFKAGLLRTLLRISIWLYAAFRYTTGVLGDILLARNTLERKAQRLRRTLEKMGPTFVKLGQQLAMRADLLPYAYCVELSKMLDSVPPFPSSVALDIIERSLGRKLEVMFAVFDQRPIGSASLACVFQAVLRNGDKVAVKVRRPGIGYTLAADLRAFDWLTRLAEWLSIVRPGSLRDLRNDLRHMLMEELDFRREARYTEIFRKRAREMEQTYITAPRIYFDYSSDEVMVSEFIQGIFMSEVLGAMDKGDNESVSQLSSRGIDPKVLAQRMLKIFNWEALESLLFHADPHPANIIVRPDNRLVFIDFGSCGRFNDRSRRIWQRLHEHLNNEDVGGVVEAAIALMEPLPPIDLNRFSRELELLYWDWFYALKSDHAEWYERSTGLFWIKLAGIARRYGIPVTLDTLMMFRTIFAYDSIMYRLWAKLDPEEEYQKYRGTAGRRAERRVKKAWKSRLLYGPSATDYIRIEEGLRMVGQLGNRIQHQLDMPNHRFMNVLGKAAYGISMTLRFFTVAFVFHLLALVTVLFWRRDIASPQPLSDAFFTLVGSPTYQITAVVVAVVVMRKVLMRLQDVDIV